MSLPAPTAPAPATDLVLRDVRPWGGDRVDLHVAGGLIAAVTPHDPAVPAPSGSTGAVVDGNGLLALPGLVNAHAHVDKS
ncbi:hypothetical protein [Cellulosimicrobium marinum]|uniref:hypothetical protein n=1 Tax=Cellulosimicrobium marinum TaxID=1638992 RepID=UPI001E54D955|nr:hypothetical protein [Cellulosimicrobium marinum]MCB7135367.1 hypothetical protein [Cellulosimicrobium marinum]